MQAPSTVFMVKPDHFGYNAETAQSNAFQKEILICKHDDCRRQALEEFHLFVELLKSHKIDVLVFDSPRGKHAPDAVFPNNWVSFHQDGKVVLYPMLTENRRVERRVEIVNEIGKRFQVNEIIDLSTEEENGRILEGTGSMVFDLINKIAYANESTRTNKHLFYDVCQMLGYEGIFFRAFDDNGLDIYHTNVLLTIGEGFAIICKAVLDSNDSANVINSLQGSGLEVINISYEQMKHFAGNMIQLKNKEGHSYLVMSKSAHDILEEKQKNPLSKYANLIYSDLKTIETIGGGSARCMIAGIYLPLRSITIS